MTHRPGVVLFPSDLPLDRHQPELRPYAEVGPAIEDFGNAGYFNPLYAHDATRLRIDITESTR